MLSSPHHLHASWWEPCCWSPSREEKTIRSTWLPPLCSALPPDVVVRPLSLRHGELLHTNPLYLVCSLVRSLILLLMITYANHVAYVLCKLSLSTYVTYMLNVWQHPLLLISNLQYARTYHVLVAMAGCVLSLPEQVRKPSLLTIELQWKSADVHPSPQGSQKECHLSSCLGLIECMN